MIQVLATWIPALLIALSGVLKLTGNAAIVEGMTRLGVGRYLRLLGVMELAASLDMKGASVFLTGAVPGLPNRLPTLPPDYPETDALCLVQSFYRLAIRVAEARGYDADQPRHLTKVTRTR